MLIRSRGFLILVLVLLAAGAGVLAWLSSWDDGAGTAAERLPTLELIEESSVPFLDFVPGSDVAWLEDDRLVLIDGDLHRLALLRLDDGPSFTRARREAGPGSSGAPMHSTLPPMVAC